MEVYYRITIIYCTVVNIKILVLLIVLTVVVEKPPYSVLSTVCTFVARVVYLVGNLHTC